MVLQFCMPASLRVESPVGILVEVMSRCSSLCIWMWIHAAGSEGKFLYPVWTKFKPVLMGC